MPSLGGAQVFIYAGDKIIGELINKVPKKAYTWGTDGHVLERILGTGANSLWYHFGPQGETRYLTNSLGNVADSYVYSAYGLPIASTGTDSNAFRYGGKYGYYTEGGNGLMLATYRWYSPYLMRWLSRDPIGYDGGTNLYEYVNGRPAFWVDPSGKGPVDPF